MQIGLGSGSPTLEDISTIFNKRLVIDCPVMRLYRRGCSQDAPAHEGSGTIYQTDTGEINFKLLTAIPQNAQDLDTLFRAFNRPAGLLSAETDEYDLHASDTRGQEWVAERIWRDGQFGNYGCTLKSSVGLAAVRTLTSALGINKDSVTVYFPESPKLPFTHRTTLEERLGEDVRWRSYQQNTALLKTDSLEYEINCRDGMLRITMTSSIPHSLPPIQRITEAVRFVTAKFVNPFYSVVTSGESREVIIRPIKLAESTRRMPPLRPDLPDKDDFWALFQRYLGFVQQDTSERVHPVSQRVHAALTAGANFLEADALGLSAAVEGLVKSCFAEASLPSRDLLDQIAAAKLLVKKSSLDESMKKRLLGSLGAMGKPRPIDRLHELADAGLVSRGLVETWKRLRDSAAHAEAIDLDKLQEAIDSIMAVATLFNQLVFILIGYQGKYTDYSEHGFPVADFRNSHRTG